MDFQKPGSTQSTAQSALGSTQDSTSFLQHVDPIYDLDDMMHSIAALNRHADKAPSIQSDLAYGEKIDSAKAASAIINSITSGISFPTTDETLTEINSLFKPVEDLNAKNHQHDEKLITELAMNLIIKQFTQGDQLYDLHNENH